MSGFDPIIDMKAIEQLANNPTQMATRLLALEKRAREWKIGTDPARRAGLLEQLKSAAALSESDTEAGHQEADDLLLAFINDEEISNAYGEVKKYYQD
jgi:hypothetical protein